MSRPTEYFGHPRGLTLLFFTEMWERFSYYGMRAIFTLYMTKALLFDKALASAIYGDYTGLVYLTPLLGGFIADRYWGNRKSIIVGGAMMAMGQFCMFISALNYQTAGFATAMMFLGLGLLIFGNGFFKPNISTMVGSLYKEGDKRVDSAFSIFYMGINAGALLAPLVCGGFGDTGLAHSFKWGFLAACVGMLVSLAAFIMLKDSFIVTPEGMAIGTVPAKAVAVEGAAPVAKRSTWPWLVLIVVLFILFKGHFNLDYIGSFIFACCIIAPLVIVTDPGLNKVERDRIWVIIIMAFFVICFWAAFEQAGASLTFFAEEQTDRNLLGFSIPASFFQVINPTFIVIFAPVMVLLWGFLGRRNQEPPSLIKQAIGLVLVGVGYILICFCVKGMDPNSKVAIWWLISLYFIHTIAELCLSPIGLSMVVRLAPARLGSLMMGVWFLSTAFANWTAGALSALYPQDVNKDASVVAASFTLNNPSDTVNATTTLSIDSTFQTGSLANGGTWKVSLDSDDDPKPAEPTYMETFVNNFKSDPLLKALNSDAKSTDKVLSITQVQTTSNVKLETYIAKQAGIAIPEKPDPKAHKFLTGYSEDGKTLYVLKDDKGLEVWNLAPEKPSILGFEIKNMYSFFMIFVFMAIISGVILFLLSKVLLKMMHGIK